MKKMHSCCSVTFFLGPPSYFSGCQNNDDRTSAFITVDSGGFDWQTTIIRVQHEGIPIRSAAEANVANEMNSGRRVLFRIKNENPGVLCTSTPVVLNAREKREILLKIEKKEKSVILRQSQVMGQGENLTICSYDKFVESGKESTLN